VDGTFKHEIFEDKSLEIDEGTLFDEFSGTEQFEGYAFSPQPTNGAYYQNIC
jgi:hypothetical protein